MSIAKKNGKKSNSNVIRKKRSAKDKQKNNSLRKLNKETTKSKAKSESKPIAKIPSKSIAKIPSKPKKAKIEMKTAKKKPKPESSEKVKKEAKIEKVELKKEKTKIKKISKTKPAKNEIDEQITAKAKTLWATNFKELNAKQRKQKVNEILPLLKGSYAKASRKREHSRVLEICLKHTDPAHCDAFLKEIKSDFNELCCQKHSKHVIISLLHYAPKRLKSDFFKIFYKSGPSLFTNRYGSVVFDTFFRTCPPSKKILLLSPLIYPPALLPADLTDREKPILTFSDLLSAAPDEVSKRAILSNTKRLVDKIVDKELLTTAANHFLISEFTKNCVESEKTEIYERLASHALLLAQSKVGSQLASAAFSSLSPKLKKTFIKSIKEKTVEMVTDESGWLIVFSCLNGTDDTVLLRKTLLKPLVEELENGAKGSTALNKSFQKCLLQLLSRFGKRFTSPEEGAVLRPADDGAVCKKSFEKRRSEILETVAAPLAERLLSEGVDEVSKSVFGRELLVETVNAALGPDTAALFNAETLEKLGSALGRLLAELGRAENPHLLRNNFAVRVFGAATAEAPPKGLSRAFARELSGGLAARFFDAPDGHALFSQWAQSCAAFFIAAVLKKKGVFGDGFVKKLIGAVEKCGEELKRSGLAGARVVSDVIEAINNDK